MKRLTRSERTGLILLSAVALAVVGISRFNPGGCTRIDREAEANAIRILSETRNSVKPDSLIREVPTKQKERKRKEKKKRTNQAKEESKKKEMSRGKKMEKSESQKPAKNPLDAPIPLKRRNGAREE